MNLTPPAPLTAYTWRAIQPNDLAAMYQLLLATVTVDKPESPPSEQHLQHLLGMLGDQLAYNSLAGLTSDGALVASVFVFFPPDDEKQLALFDGAVHVDWRGRGIGRFLIKWVEQRARQEFSVGGDNLPQLLRTSCMPHQTDRIALFTQQSFHAARYSYTMRRSLSQPIPEYALPDGLRWVQWTPTLDAPLMQVFNRAFQGHYGLPVMNEALWRNFFTGVPQFRGDLTYLVMAGEEIVGFCLNWVDQAKNAAAERQEGWIEAIGVLPEWRGQGLAAALMAHALRLFQHEGLQQAGLDVDTQNPTGALRLYEKFGFSKAKETISFVKNLNDHPTLAS